MKKAKTPLKTEGDKDRGRCQAHVEVVILVAVAAKDHDVRSKVTERQVRRRQCDRRGNPKGYEHHACGSDAFAFHRADERLLGPIVWRNDQPQIVLVKELGPKPVGGIHVAFPPGVAKVGIAQHRLQHGLRMGWILSGKDTPLHRSNVLFGIAMPCQKRACHCRANFFVAVIGFGVASIMEPSGNRKDFLIPLA